MTGSPGRRATVVVTGAGGVELEVQRHGPAAAPAVVLQHGVGSSRRFLGEAVAPPVVAAGWQVVLAPVRGHRGSSRVPDPDDHALPLLARDVAAVVQATGAVACGGVSIGGHAAVAAAADGLVETGTRVVAALPAWSGTAVTGDGPHAAVAAEVRAVGVSGMWRRLATAPDVLPWLRSVLLRDLALHDEESLAAAFVALDGGEAPTPADVGRVAGRVGVVGWDHDPGHPLAVAHRWAMAARDGHLETLSITDPGGDAVALGRAVAAALGAP